MWLMVWIVNNMRHCQWNLANMLTSPYCCKLWLTAACPLKLISWKLMPIVRQLFRRNFWRMLAWLIAGLFFWFYLPIVRNILFPLLLSCDIRSRKVWERQLFQCRWKSQHIEFPPKSGNQGPWMLAVWIQKAGHNDLRVPLHLNNIIFSKSYK